MKAWMSKKPHPYNIWVSEIRLKSVSIIRKGKVMKLLKLLREGFSEEVS